MKWFEENYEDFHSAFIYSEAYNNRVNRARRRKEQEMKKGGANSKESADWKHTPEDRSSNVIRGYWERFLGGYIN